MFVKQFFDTPTHSPHGDGGIVFICNRFKNSFRFSEMQFSETQFLEPQFFKPKFSETQFSEKRFPIVICNNHKPTTFRFVLQTKRLAMNQICQFSIIQ
jgi:hypothetical protein